MLTIQRPSVASLLLEIHGSGGRLGVATGFVVSRTTRKYLVTNRHVVTGRHQESGQPLHRSGAVPEGLGVWHHTKGALGSWERRPESLYDATGRARWYVHPELGPAVDVVALALTSTAGIDLYEYPLGTQEPALALNVSGQVFIVGFPFGVTGGGRFGVWSTASIATEPVVDWSGLPLLLVDSRSRPGQSGSPVIQYSAGGPVALADGGTGILGGPVERLVGVYSGRINDESDLGFVWKLSVVQEILDGKVKEET